MQDASIKPTAFRPIGLRMVRIVALVAAGCAVTAMALQIVYGIRKARDAFDVRVKEVTAMRVPILATALWDIEPRLAQAQIDDIATTAPISGVRLVTAAGINLQAGAWTHGAVPDVTLDILPPSGKGGALGRLFLTFDRGYLVRQVAIDTAFTVILIGLFTALLCILLIRFLRAEISIPLKRLRDHVGTLSPDALDVTLSPVRPYRPWHDELDQLSEGFATLHGGIARYVSERNAAQVALADERDQLEAKVNQRTQDLSDANDALRKYKAAVDCSSAAILITDRDARIEYVNAAYTQVTGYSADEMLGKVPELLRHIPGAESGNQDLWQTLMSGAQWHGEVSNARKDGTLMWLDASVAPVYTGDHHITHIVAVNSDITHRKQMEEELWRQAVTDSLTGVANRRRLMEAGAQEILRVNRTAQPLSVLVIDIDNFKRVNDSLGHAAGDFVIQAVAKMCGEVVRVLDTVGRLGGEEFAIILPVTYLAGAEMLAERLRANIEAAELKWGTTPIAITVSIGVAQSTARIGHFPTLLNLADAALYEAKRTGRNRVCVSGINQPAVEGTVFAGE